MKRDKLEVRVEALERQQSDYVAWWQVGLGFMFGLAVYFIFQFGFEAFLVLIGVLVLGVMGASLLAWVFG